jgi:uncharacterized membrane protein
VGGSALALLGLTRKSKAGLAVAATGGFLAYKGAQSTPSSEKTPAKAVFNINCTPEQAYQFWHNFENLPRFMRHLQSVKMVGDKRSEWVAEGPMGTPVQWTAETTQDVTNQRIAWRSLPGSQLMNSGSVEFKSGGPGRGTVVVAKMEYSAPAGPLGRAVATLTGKHPEFTIREAVRRFKAILEAGEAPTTLQQPHGPRGVHGRTEEALFREKGNMAQPQAGSENGSQPQGGNREQSASRPGTSDGSGTSLRRTA